MFSQNFSQIFSDIFKKKQVEWSNQNFEISCLGNSEGAPIRPWTPLRPQFGRGNDCGLITTPWKNFQFQLRIPGRRSSTRSSTKSASRQSSRASSRLSGSIDVSAQNTEEFEDSPAKKRLSKLLDIDMVSSTPSGTGLEILRLKNGLSQKLVPASTKLAHVDL